MEDVECPYCELSQEINHDDGYGYEEGKVYEQNCNCGKTFIYTTEITYYHEAKKADCKNGSEHEFKPETTYPKCFTKMSCTMCDENREPTDEERVTFDIPSKAEYLKELNQ
jgi:hypothetical protein